jgi:hypothetical protein
MSYYNIDVKRLPISQATVKLKSVLDDSQDLEAILFI